MGKLLWNIVRLLSAALVLLAIVVQSSALAGGGAWDPTRFYAYFTIQSNLIGVAAFLWAFRRRNAPPSRGLDLFRGASAAYLTVTFFVVTRRRMAAHHVVVSEATQAAAGNPGGGTGMDGPRPAREPRHP
jgi:peptidoglycan/LPS O-acetylase OafA/YrhL